MVYDILIPLAVIALAELGDKTQLSILLLSSKTKNHMHLLAGVMLAFLLVDGFAILFGSWITGIVPTSIIKIISGAVFILFGALILVRRNKDDDGKIHYKNPFLSGFALIFISEWGDKTQIASGLFATQYNAVLVLVGVMAALLLTSVAAVYLGRLISDKVERKMMAKVSGSLFIIMGAAFFLL